MTLARARTQDILPSDICPRTLPQIQVNLKPNQLPKLKITAILTLNFADSAVAIPNVSFLFTHNFQRNPKALNITHNPNGKK